MFLLVVTNKKRIRFLFLLHSLADIQTKTVLPSYKTIISVLFPFFLSINAQFISYIDFFMSFLFLFLLTFNLINFLTIFPFQEIFSKQTKKEGENKFSPCYYFIHLLIKCQKPPRRAGQFSVNLHKKRAALRSPFFSREGMPSDTPSRAGWRGKRN